MGRGDPWRDGCLLGPGCSSRSDRDAQEGSAAIARSTACLRNRNYPRLPRTLLVPYLLRLLIDLNFSFSSDHVEEKKKSLFAASLPLTAV